MKVAIECCACSVTLTVEQIIIPSLVGRVPDEIVRCFVALLDFAYQARRNAHNTATLMEMERALERFHTERIFFETAGIRPEDEAFSLPRQHALSHYIYGIRNFGSPNGLDSSITESKHIDAVKKPWRRSNRNHALEQILKTNTRMYKLAAARIEFGRKGLLDGGLMDDAERIAAARADGVADEDLDIEVYGHVPDDDPDEDPDAEADDHDRIDVDAVQLPWSADTEVRLSRKHGTYIQHLPRMSR
jgi:hypothetical protein